MLLSRAGCDLFFKLHKALMLYVQQRLQVLPENPQTTKEYEKLPYGQRLKVHTALRNHRELIEEFVEQNPSRLTPDELAIVRSWKHFVAGSFFILQDLKNYTVFLSDEKPPVAYGVVGLTQTMAELLGPNRPRLMQTILLPFQGKIVYDGLLAGHNVMFGSGVRKSVLISLKEAKQRAGIVTSLPANSPSTDLSKDAPRRAAKKAAIANPFAGRWRIEEMDLFDSETMDEDKKAFIEFNSQKGGKFHFAYVRGEMDCRVSERNGESIVEWSWVGNDEMDEAHGRGWATVKGDHLAGVIYFHQGDESTFRARRASPTRSRKK